VSCALLRIDAGAPSVQVIGTSCTPAASVRIDSISPPSRTGPARLPAPAISLSPPTARRFWPRSAPRAGAHRPIRSGTYVSDQQCFSTASR
jgi:hypothetical protein